MPKLMRALMAVAAGALLVFAGQETRALASATTGAIAGTVTDASGHPLANVAVSAVSPSMTEKTRTGSNGFYALQGLSPDTYTVTFTLEGYQPQQVLGLTIVQGESYTQSVNMQNEAKVIGTVAVRSAASLVQPKAPADTYTVSPKQIQNITGTPQNISETALLDALPGITTDSNGYPIIRGGAENEEGYELQGVDATDPITGQFINSLSLAGESSVVLSTGGYDVSAGNTNAGVVNEVIKRGTYPGEGEMTATVNAPNFDHRFALDYGNATADNRFSYFFGFNGLRQFRSYGDGKTFLPRLVGAVGDASGNIGTTNIFYRWGTSNANELEYMGETGASVFYLNYGVNPNTTPYSSFNNIVQLDTGGTCVPGGAFGISCTGGTADSATFFPGQTAIQQNTGYPDNENNVHTIEKLNYKRQFSASSFGDFFVFRTIEADVFLLPWNGGAFGDNFEHNVNNNLGLSFDYTNQFNSQHEVSFGGETIYTNSKYDLGQPGFAPLVFPFMDPPGFNTVPCGTPTTGCFPLLAGLVNDPLHRNNLWLQDKWTPTDKWTIQPGLRWDEERLDIPANAASQNLSLSFANTGIFEIAGPPIGSDVTRPTQVSPRLAISFQANATNTFRMSYGKNIEFTPFSNIEFKWAGNPATASVPVGPFAGFSPTCRMGHDPQNGNVPCNGITNLYQLNQDVFNTSFFAQYTPVRPQRATNVDASWEHDFGRGLQMKITPYYRKGVDYVVANTPLLLTLPDGTPVFGSPREVNAGENINTGVEFSLQKLATYGWGGFINATYDNTLANYNTDFFPGVNNAALALGHMFHVSYLAPITGAVNLSFDTHSGFHASAEVPYESGYRYGVGTHTFAYVTNAAGKLVPMEVLNTDLAETFLGNNANTSAYYFTDPANPGTIAHPNITGSRGTPDGTDPGTLKGPAVATLNLSLAHDIGTNGMEAGFRVSNLFGNYTDAVVGGNSRYRNNGLGGFSSTSGTNLVNPLYEPYQYARSPLPFENEPTGAARLWTFFVSTKF
ncbi:MAG TPA: TonB-dependent receptor [Candidatus Eremiobacteraceae bacterium]|jgi:hypothetical protein